MGRLEDILVKVGGLSDSDRGAKAYWRCILQRSLGGGKPLKEYYFLVVLGKPRLRNERCEAG